MQGAHDAAKVGAGGGGSHKPPKTPQLDVGPNNLDKNSLEGSSAKNSPHTKNSPLGGGGSAVVTPASKSSILAASPKDKPGIGVASPKGRAINESLVVGGAGDTPLDIDILDIGSLSPRSESLSYSKRVIAKMQSTAGTPAYAGKPVSMQRGSIKVTHPPGGAPLPLGLGTGAHPQPKSLRPKTLFPQVSGHNLDCELIQYACGKIDADGSGAHQVPVYMHVMQMTLPANSVGAMPYRPILEKLGPGGVEKGATVKDWLFAENWALNKIGVGAGLNLRFSGRPPASADRTIAEPFVQNVDVNRLVLDVSCLSFVSLCANAPPATPAVVCYEGFQGVKVFS